MNNYVYKILALLAEFRIVLRGGSFMSVRNAGKTIRQARLKAGLTQEKLSEGICTAFSLSRIENGTAGVSPSTFQALMEKTGFPCEVFPVFFSQKDFHCFYILKKARYYIDSWQLDHAYQELLRVQDMNWADNKFYYQEWLLLYCKIQFRSCCNDHMHILNTLIKALRISQNDIKLEKFEDMLLSLIEIELLIGCAQEYLYLHELSTCLTICRQINNYLKHSTFNSLESNRLLAENAIVYTKYFFAIGNNSKALEFVEYHRHQMVLDIENPLLYELTFLSSIGYYRTGDVHKAKKQFEAVFYSSYAIESCYATTCKKNVINLLHFPISADIISLPEIPYISILPIAINDSCHLHNGIYNLSTTILYFGDLIRSIRTEKKLSQTIVCQGLCSKSKLSKIENNILQPSVALAEALLQRLGISERIFTFWGDEREQKLYDLKYSLIHSTRTRHREYKHNLKTFKSLLTKDDSLYLQFYLTELAQSEKNHNNKIKLLFDALYMTLPNFDIYHIADYRLSHMELTILNCISLEYAYTDKKYNGGIIAHALLEYMIQCQCDFFMQIYVFSITTSILCNLLYKQNLHNEVINLQKYISTSYYKYGIQFLGQFLFYYCQSLAECKQNKEAVHYAKCCCAIQNLIEFDTNADILKKNMQEDFNIIF